MKRRGFIALGAAAAGVAGIASFAALRQRGAELLEWRGIVFGAEASILLASRNEAEAGSIFEACQAEARRLESIFTLYDSASALRRLNRDGKLPHPPPELAEILRISAEVHDLTGGAFDVTVQPLWELYSEHFRRNLDDATGPPTARIDEARAKVGFEHVRVSDEEISFAKPGMSITLNGIAQGFVTDRITELLLKRGVTSALVNLGEFRALGDDPDGEPWAVGIANPGGDDQQLLDVIGLSDRALASSGGYGFRFDGRGSFHHLFNPADSTFADQTRTISVEHRGAARADALATAGSVMNWDDFAALKPALGDVTLRVYEDGAKREV